MGASPKYRRRDEAARYIRDKWNQPCQPKTLAKLAVLGGGPVYRKAGRFPLYTDDDLDAWAEARIGAPQLSTSVSLCNVGCEDSSLGGVSRLTRDVRPKTEEQRERPRKHAAIAAAEPGA